MLFTLIVIRPTASEGAHPRGEVEEVLRCSGVNIEDCNLLSLVDSLLTMLDSQLLTIFVERWHKETYSFHFPFGEMTITLNDVSSLFHLPLARSFFITSLISQQLACINSIRDLGITKERVIEELGVTRVFIFTYLSSGIGMET